MAVSVGVRRAVAQPGARAGLLIVALIGWVITRVPMYVIDAGIVRVPRHQWFIGDVVIYQEWLRFFVGGGFPVADPRWQYPPGAAAVLGLPHLLPGSYADSFYLVQVFCDLAITILVAHMAIRRGSWLGCWCWLGGIALLGPVVLGHFDYAPTLLAVLALYLADFAWGLGALAGLGAAVKVWPLVVLVGVKPGQVSKAAAGAIATAGAVVGGYLIFTHGSLSFLANQDSRGLEIESIAAQPFLILRELGMWHGHIAYQYGSLQLVGPGVGIAATLTLGSMVLALILLACWRWRMSWRPEVVGDAALVAVLLIVSTSRVISTQYMIWLVGIAACALAFPRTSQRPVGVMLMITCGLTLLESRFLLKDIDAVGVVGAIGIAVLVVRDALLLSVAILGFVRLWRSTCSQQPVRSQGVLFEGSGSGQHAAGRRARN